MADRRKDSNGRVLKSGESQRKDGRYQYRYNDFRGERRYVYADTLQKLREKENQIQKDMADQIDTVGGEKTLNEQFERYMRIHTNIAETTRQNYRYMWRKFIEDTPLGRMPICKVKKSDILAFYSKCSAQGLENGTIQIFQKMLHPSLELAVEEDEIRKNPAKGCMKDYDCSGTKRQALTQKQEAALLEFIRKSNVFHKYYPLFYFMLETGCRIGEVMGLTWDKDVNLKEGYVQIDHQLLYRDFGGEKKAFHIVKPKTEAGIRKIPITSEVKKQLLQQKLI